MLRLYILKSQPFSEQIVRKLTGILDAAIKDNYLLKVVDIESEPEQAERDNILAAPALLRVEPKPEKKVIGDLVNSAQVLQALDLPREYHGQER